MFIDVRGDGRKKSVEGENDEKDPFLLRGTTAELIILYLKPERRSVMRSNRE